MPKKEDYTVSDEPFQTVNVTVDHEIRQQILESRVDQMLLDLDNTYQFELHKLADISVKIKKKIDESLTNTKDSYYTSKLEKNNQKIYDMLLQYEQSKTLLLKKKELILGEKKNVNPQEI